MATSCRTLSQSAGTYARGGWEDLPIGLSYGLVGLAVLHPSMAALTFAAPTREHRLTHGRVAILGLALLAAPATMVMTGRTVLPFTAAVVLSLLVLVRLWRLVIERETGRDGMRRQATRDPLTGLPNRTSLLERLDDLLARRSPADPADAVLFLDLDGFKRVNDAWGHAAGDQLLVAVAARLQAASRQDDLLARLAGDEFVLVCERIGQRDAVGLAERLIAVLSTPFALSGGPAQVGASIGMTLHTAGGAGAEALLAEADAAMYQAKQRGGSAYEIDGVTLGARLQRRRKLEVDLVDALQTGGLRLEYQPVVALEPGGRSASRRSCAGTIRISGPSVPSRR
ncbi:MAG: diguanylate cyclase domain-containing protein [Egibacteraceae bacterium]